MKHLGTWTWFSKCWRGCWNPTFDVLLCHFVPRHASEKCRGDREIARVAIKHHGTETYGEVAWVEAACLHCMSWFLCVFEQRLFFQMVSLISYTRLCSPLLTNRFVGSYELPWTPCLNDDDHHHHHHNHIQIVQIDNVPHDTSCFQGKTLKYLDRCPSKLTWIWYIADVPLTSLWVVEG